MKQLGGAVLVVVAALALWWFLGNTPEEARKEQITATGVMHEIVLTDDGYVPKESTITVGDTVVFRNETDHPFWPASNLHPSHRDYPEFDPREPVLADETWSFTFGQVGEWKFHDHLAPYYTGVIVVSE